MCSPWAVVRIMALEHKGEMKAAGALTKPEALSQGVALPRSGEKPAQPALCGGGLIGV